MFPISRLALSCSLCGLLVTAATAQDETYTVPPSVEENVDPSMFLQQGSAQSEADKIADNIYKATGFGNTFLVVTDEGNVVIDTSLVQNAEIMIPSHGEPVVGADDVRATLTKYRDAILYVHDKTVAGMNAGKSVHELMQTIKLPDELAIAEGYGRISWSVRGIYEGYSGWFNGDMKTLGGLAPATVLPTLVEMSGGVNNVVDKAAELVKSGNLSQALALADAALTADPDNRKALEVKLKALEATRNQTDNINEAGWLNYGIRTTQAALGMDGQE